MERYVICEGEKVCFALPPGWKVLFDEEKPPVPGVADPVAEINRALDNPIGSPRLEEIAKPGMDVVIVFDDLQRPTPAHLAMPEVMNRLNKAGIPDSSMLGICALGTHPVLPLDLLEKKVGKEAAARLKGRLLSHDPHASSNVIIGKTHRGTLVEINRHVANADLIVGIGECMPHPTAGFGGGYKIILPGVSSYRSVADHHFAWLRHRNSRVNIKEGNYFYEDIVDAGKISRIAFKLDMVINEKKEIIQAFAGETMAEHTEASEFAASLYWVPLPRVSDITITSAFPLEVAVQATKALSMARYCTRSGGIIIWVAPQKEAGPIMPLVQEMASDETATDFHRRLIEGKVPDHLTAFGISYIMQVVFFKEISERFDVIHVTEGLPAETVKMMKFTHARTLAEAIDMAAKKMPTADVTIFPAGGNIIPGVA